MPIKCVLGDVDGLRSQQQPGQPRRVGVLEKIWTSQFPPSAVADAFRASRFCRALSVEVKTYEEQLLKLAREYGEPGEDGAVTVPPDKLKTYLEAKAKLDAVEHEVETVPLKVSVLGHLTSLSAAEAYALEKFVEEVPE